MKKKIIFYSFTVLTIAGVFLFFAAIAIIVSLYIINMNKVVLRDTLKMNTKFKIAYFTDLHLSYIERHIYETQQIISQILLYERPDFAIIGGDFINTDNQRLAYYYNKMIDPFINYNVSWALLFGNHDDPNYLNFTLHQKDHTAAMNYIIELYSENALIFNIVLIGVNYSCIFDREWYNRQKLDSSKSIVFTHVPVKEMELLKNIVGTYGEPVDYQGNSILDARAMFFGHDHKNDFSGVYMNTYLAYGRRTGSNWGVNSNLNVGARIIELNIDGSFKTWIREAF